MSERPEPGPTVPRPLDQRSEPRTSISPFAFVLALGWLIVPAVQYYATSVRTRFQLGEAGAGATPGPIVEWDLTQVYLLLVAATALFAVLRYLAGRRAGGRDSASPEPGGNA